MGGGWVLSPAVRHGEDRPEIHTADAAHHRRGIRRRGLGAGGQVGRLGRAQLRYDGRSVSLRTRHGRECAADFPELAAIAGHGGVEIHAEADAFLVALPDPGAVAIAGQRALRAHAWPGGSGLRVRMGVHTSSPSARPHGAGARAGRQLLETQDLLEGQAPAVCINALTLSTLPAHQSRRGHYGSSPRSSIAISSASGGRWPVSIIAAIDASSSSVRSRVSTPTGVGGRRCRR